MKKDQYFLTKLEFEGNQKVLSEELDDIIPVNQKPNTRPFNLPITPRVGFYNYGLNRFDSAQTVNDLLNLRSELATYPQNFSDSKKIENKKQKIKKRIDRKQESLETKIGWFWRNIGEPKAIINTSQIQQTSELITKYLKDIGFKDAQTLHRIDSLNAPGSIKLVYLVSEGDPYLIDTVKYYVEDAKLDSLFEVNRKDQLIKPGNRFDIRLVELERSRLENLAKNNGYYNFLPQYILFGADNASGDLEEFIKNKGGNLYFNVVNLPGQDNHKQYEIKEVVFKAFDPYSNNNNVKLDTTYFNGIKFITMDRRIPIGILANKLVIKQGQQYSLKNVIETQRQIGYLNQFAFASSQVNVLSDNQLSMEFFAPLLEKYTLGTGPGLNHLYNQGQGFIGFGIPVTLTARNWAKRLEIVEASFRAFWEGQPSPIDATSIRGSLELGANLAITYPNISFFGKRVNKLSLFNPRTQLGGGVNYSEPFWGNRLNFRLNTNYSWRPTQFTTILFSVLDANLINTNYNLSNPDGAGAQFYQSLLDQQARGNNLKVTFDPQFVSSFNGTYIFNNQNPQKPYGSSKYFRVFLESGGTFMNFGSNKDRINLIESLLPLRQDLNSPDTVRAYFRFVKVNLDYRRYVNINLVSSFAYRFNIGLTNPYGKNKSLPYEKNFFAGGSNSVRAWSPRGLGTGSALPDTAANNVIPQPGDIILEGSIEWRRKIARFVGDIQFATFIDYGNIWKWYQIETPEKKDKANFDFSRFYKEFAVGTGFGIRWDFSFFLARFDFGIKVMDPSRDIGDRFVLDDFSLKKKQPYGIQFNVGIGYPF
ncbi:Outer membrane protein assembly factor BamA [Spirosomataceae bacterium TFI 002]|nr:Outer membrane protein assembly factor BamA [Spirosomataceae bacterium TFI 002]